MNMLMLNRRYSVMNIIDIITTKNELDNELRIALSTMEKKEDIE